MSKFEHPLTVAITVLSSEQLTAVYALLGGASLAAVAVSGSGKPVSVQPSPTSDAPAASATEAAPAVASTETAPAGDPNEVDAGGHPWSADLHASTRGTTKDGYWRMKVGVSRPADLPGFPKGTGTDTATSPTSASGQGATQADPAPASTADDDDEFAAFRAAAAKTDAEDASAKASVPPRKWTDADLGALCNQAAVKLGDPAPVKAIIAEYVTEGETPHSRNIPEDKRAAFAAAIEAKAGIEFAG